MRCVTDTSDALTARSAGRDPAGVLGDLVTSASFRRPSNVFDSAWVEHAPFAFWLVDVLRPRTVVELGVWTGFSFLTFCDAVAASGLDTRCIGIDTWEGDAHAGVLSPDVAEIVAARADRYGDRAELVRSNFDAAAPAVPPQFDRSPPRGRPAHVRGGAPRRRTWLGRSIRAGCARPPRLRGDGP